MPIRVVECARIPEEKSSEVWETLLGQQKYYSFFQTPRWLAILQSTLNHGAPYAHWFRFSDGREAVLPLFALAKRWGIAKLESLPWGTYGDLIGAESLSQDHRAAAASRLLSIRRPICEITLPPVRQTQFEEERSPQIETRPAFTHILTLSNSFEDVWENQFQARNRTAIRRAQDRGVNVAWSNGAEGVVAIKTLYQAAVRRWEGVETLPLRFFDALAELPNDEVRIWLARKDECLLAADVLFYGRGEAQYFAGASDSQRLELNGSKLLMSEIIRDACERGFQRFNFGASGGLQGVERFKEIFGGRPASYTRLRFTHPWMQAVKKLRG